MLWKSECQRHDIRPQCLGKTTSKKNTRASKRNTRASKKNTSHGMEMLPQDTTYLTQRPCYLHAKIQHLIGPHENLLTTVKRRKLQRYGHVSGSPDLAKTIFQGTVKGGGRVEGRQKRWEDNIRDWTGLGFAKSQRAVGNREKRRDCEIICGAPTTIAVKG